MTTNIITQEYQLLLNDLKKRVESARYRSALSINKELTLLYHHIGTQILDSQDKHGWGGKVIEQLSRDLKSDFPEMKGFSPQNLKYMKRFAQEYKADEIGQQAVDQLPWGHIILLMYSILDREIRSFYIRETIQCGWSRNMLSIQIETGLHKRQGNAITNFKDKLPSPQSDFSTGNSSKSLFIRLLEFRQRCP